MQHADRNNGLYFMSVCRGVWYFYQGIVKSLVKAVKGNDVLEEFIDKGVI